MFDLITEARDIRDYETADAFKNWITYKHKLKISYTKWGAFFNEADDEGIKKAKNWLISKYGNIKKTKVVIKFLEDLSFNQRLSSECVEKWYSENKEEINKMGFKLNPKIHKALNKEV